MTKEQMKESLCNILHEYNSMFRDISINNEMDILKVETVDGQHFMIKVDYFGNASGKKPKENYAELSLSVAIMGLFELGIIDRKKADRYLKKLANRI